MELVKRHLPQYGILWAPSEPKTTTAETVPLMFFMAHSPDLMKSRRTALAGQTTDHGHQQNSLLF